jgi:hypothetical protein
VHVDFIKFSNVHIGKIVSSSHGNKIILIKFRMTIKSSLTFNIWFERRTEELDEDLEEDLCTLS